MIKRITPNKAVVFAVSAFVAYWLVAMFVPGPVLREVFNSLSFGAAIIISITWFSAARRAMREGADTGEWQLVLAIFLLFFVLAISRLYAILFNYMDRPDSWAHSPISGFWSYSYLICALLFLSAPGKTKEGLRSSTIWSLLAAFSIGSLIAGIMIGKQFSLSSG